MAAENAPEKTTITALMAMAAKIAENETDTDGEITRRGDPIAHLVRVLCARVLEIKAGARAEIAALHKQVDGLNKTLEGLIALVKPIITAEAVKQQQPTTVEETATTVEETAGAPDKNDIEVDIGEPPPTQSQNPQPEPIAQVTLVPPNSGNTGPSPKAA